MRGKAEGIGDLATRAFGRASLRPIPAKPYPVGLARAAASRNTRSRGKRPRDIARRRDLAPRNASTLPT